MSQTKRNNKAKSKQTKSLSRVAAKAGRKGKSMSSSQGRKRHPLYGSATFFSNSSTVPSAFCNVDTNSTFQRLEGAVHHKGLGLDGIALVGCQPFANVVTTGTDSQFMTGTALATRTDVNSIAISPDVLNGPLAAQANLHAKYFFTDIMIEYVSTVATTQAGAFCMALSKNFVSNSPPADFSEARQISPSVTAPFRADRVMIHLHDSDSSELFWTELNVTTAADCKQTIQYGFFGFPSASSIGAVNQGYLNIWYRIELYQSTQTQGFTMRIKSKEEAEFLKKTLLEYRQKTADSDEKERDDEDEGGLVRVAHFRTPKKSDSTTTTVSIPRR